MVVMTAKVDLKRILMLLGLAAAVLMVLIYLLGGSQETLAPATEKVPDNDSRVAFLKSFGWEVVNSPKESGQVLIPQEPNPVFERYNALQKCQGYDLSKFAGKKVMRYVYTVENYPGATEPVYATLLVFKNKVIGGDVTDTAPGGKISPFEMPKANETSKPRQTVPSVPDATTAPTEPTVTEAPGQKQ